jgi:electron transport complex protein RnfB
MSHADLIARLDVLLPQTQCRQCGYAGCNPYAEAMAAGRAGANQCPPGGDDGARALAEELGVAYTPVDQRFGTTKPPSFALIDETKCIGCALCIQACPVDAIVGAAKYMHTVIVDDCTGCELCLQPCPVDCIAMVATGAVADRGEQRGAAQRARKRFAARERRLLRNRAAAEKDIAHKAAVARKRRVVQGAIERAQLRLALRREPR